MKNNFLNIVMAVLAGISIPAIPYTLFGMMVEKFGEDFFHLHPQFLAVILGLVLLCLGGYMTGKILGKGKCKILRPSLIVLVTPGLYLGIAGFVITFIIDSSIPKDGVIALSFMSLALICVTTPFTFWGYKRNIK